MTAGPASPPDRLETARFVLRPLRIEDAVLDHAAVMASAELLRVWSGSDWPAPGFSVLDNEEDLARHQEEHDAGDAFAYTVVSPGGERCLGCVYIEPPARWLDEAPDAVDADAVVGLWVVADRVDDLERHLFEAVDAWLTTAWPIERPVYRTHEDDTRQRRLFEGAGLVESERVAVEGRRGRFALFTRDAGSHPSPGT